MARKLCHSHHHTNQKQFVEKNIFCISFSQIVCGPDLQFFEIISRWPGATQENKIFNISEIHQRFEYHKMDGILLADCNYSNRTFVLTPVEVVRHHKQIKFNEAHSRTYAVKDAVDLWKRRFRCLQTVLNHKEGMLAQYIRRKLNNISLQRIRKIKFLYLCRHHTNDNFGLCSFT